MDTGTLANIGLVLLFVLIGGVFSGTEMALVSLREGQVKELEKEGGRGRAVARLARDSGLFLSAVQIGVTFAGFLSSAYGASTIAPDLVPTLQGWGLSEELAGTVALVGLTLIISYLSLVLGELVPKRVAMQRAKGFAKLTGPPLAAFAKLARPFIWLLEKSTNAVLRLLGLDPSADAEAMSDEEVRDIVTSHAGFQPEERQLLQEMFVATDRNVGEVMRHRQDIAGLQKELDVRSAVHEVLGQPYSRYPVYGESMDDVVGFVHVRDLLEAVTDLNRPSMPIEAIARDIPVFPGTMPLIGALEEMRQNGHHIAIVIDEYGGTDGLVTLEDLIEEVVGEIWDEYDTDAQRVELRLHESESFDGGTNLEDFAERTGIQLEEGPYETIAGWMLTRLGRVAAVGDSVAIPPAQTSDTEDDAEPVRYQLEVTEVDRNRITGMRLAKVTLADAEAADDTYVAPGSEGYAAHTASDGRAGGAHAAE
ncbi:hemolysin family protein [Actinomycetota bacterium]